MSVQLLDSRKVTRANGLWAAQPRYALLRELLPKEDRELLALWACGTVSIRSLAGVLHCHAGTVARRIRTLKQRMDNPLVGELLIRWDSLPPFYRGIAVRWLMQGFSRPQIAAALRISTREADVAIGVVRTLLSSKSARHSKGAGHDDVQYSGAFAH